MAVPKSSRSIDLEQILSRTRFQDLSIFESVARLGSVAAAAREKKLNPPLISKSLKKLEQAAGVSLFDRSNQGFQLTTEGREFLGFQERLTSLLSSAQSSLSRVEEKSSTLHTVAGVSFLVNHLLPETLHRIPGYGSQYRFRVMNLGQDELVARGIRGHFDIALHTQPLQWPRTWTTVPVGSLVWILCGRVGHPLGRRADEKDVRAHRFVVPAYWSDKGFRRGEDRCPIPIKQRLVGDEAGTAETALSLAVHSDQLLFVPALVAREWLSREKLQEIEVSQWSPVRDTVFLSIHAEKVSQRVFRSLTQVAAEVLMSSQSSRKN